MAVVDNAEREVVVEFGVPLSRISLGFILLIGLGMEMYSRSFGGSVGVGRRVGHANESWGGHFISSGKLEGNILPV